MPFDLEIPDHIVSYLANLPISQGIRDKIADALEQLEGLPDEFRADPTNRFPGQTILRYSYVFAAEGRLHTILFGVNDRPAVHGVLRIVHARYWAGEQPFPRLSPL